jgi:hypothetical protein
VVVAAAAVVIMVMIICSSVALYMEMFLYSKYGMLYPQHFQPARSNSTPWALVPAVLTEY